MATRLNPYLTFHGKAREAMEFYRDVLGGDLTLTTFAEGGMPDAGDPEHIMHGQLETGSGFTLMGSDAGSGSPAPPMSGVQISLSGGIDADAELTGYYEKLAAGGTVVEPLAAAPWGDKFGIVSDPYGIVWMVNISGAPSE
jgi:PhnB protein